MEENSLTEGWNWGGCFAAGFGRAWAVEGGLLVVGSAAALTVEFGALGFEDALRAKSGEAADSSPSESSHCAISVVASDLFAESCGMVMCRPMSSSTVAMLAVLIACDEEGTDALEPKCSTSVEATRTVRRV
jgi:hypothetical protein